MKTICLSLFKQHKQIQSRLSDSQKLINVECLYLFLSSAKTDRYAKIIIHKTNISENY